MSSWIDVSIPLHNGMVHWPTDPEFERTLTLDLSKGDPCNVSKVCTTAHIGTHMDAPAHFVPGGAGMEAMPIEAGIGRARVIAIQDPKQIPVSELEPHQLQPGERILFKTRNSSYAWNTDEFQKDFVYIPEATAKYLAQKKILTVGVDYLSVGGYEADGAETHRALLEGGIWIIEGLNLGAVQPGEYELICLPLKIVGGDGAPARAVLRPL